MFDITLETQQHSSGKSCPWLEQLTWWDKFPIALLFGAILGLSTTGYGLWWIPWVGLVPLLLLIQGSTSKTEACLLGLLFGLGYEMVALHWLLWPNPIHWVPVNNLVHIQSTLCLWIVKSFHQALLFAGFSLLLYLLPMRVGFCPHFQRPFYPYLLSVPLAWLFFQWVLGVCSAFGGMPITQLAYSQAQNLFIIQIARIGGSQFIDLLLLLVNGLIAAFVIETSNITKPLSQRSDRLSPQSGMALDSAIVIILVLAVMFSGQIEVQQHLSSATTFADQVSSSFNNLIPVAVLQENNNNENHSSQDTKEISSHYSLLAKNLGVPLLVLPKSIFIENQKPVSVCSSSLLSSLWGEIGPSIGLEIISPRFIASQVQNGASLLVNVCNYSESHNSCLSNELLAVAVLRAVENRRYLILSTNNGISAIINPFGALTSQSLPLRKGVLLDRVQFLYKKTPFTSMWWL